MEFRTYGKCQEQVIRKRVFEPQNKLLKCHVAFEEKT